MKLDCKKCGHKWSTRFEKQPLVCPSCKSKTWMNRKEVSRLIEERCKSLVSLAENVDYVTIAPQLLQLVMVAFSEAENEFNSGDGKAMDRAMSAMNILDSVKTLSAREILPKEIYHICWRLGDSYLRDSMVFDKSKYTEKDIRDYLLNNWDRSILKDFVLVGSEVVIEKIGRIDILAKEKNTGRDVIIELKKGSKDGYKQLFTYARSFTDPLLVNVSEKVPPVERDDILYLTFDAKHLKLTP